MAEEKKSGEELLDDPQYGYSDIGGGNLAEMPTPFTQTIDLLAVTNGEELELMCRATPPIVKATQVGYAMMYRFHSDYIRGRIDQIKRLSVSIKGQGRNEIVQSLQAGSGVPDSFYETQAGLNKGYVEE